MERLYPGSVNRYVEERTDNVDIVGETYGEVSGGEGTRFQQFLQVLWPFL